MELGDEPQSSPASRESDSTSEFTSTEPSSISASEASVKKERRP